MPRSLARPALNPLHKANAAGVLKQRICQMRETLKGEIVEHQETDADFTARLQSLLLYEDDMHEHEITQITGLTKNTIMRDPSRIGDQVNWLDNYSVKLPIHGPTLGVVAGDITASVNDAKYANYVLGTWLTAVRAFSPSTTDAVDDVLTGGGTGAMVLPTFTAPALPAGVTAAVPGTLNCIFALVSKMKLSAGCQCVKLTFAKYGHMGVYIESRRGTGAWEFQAIDTESPYMDERPLLAAGVPEVREYRMRFWDKGTPNGDWTDVVKVTVSP